MGYSVERRLEGGKDGPQNAFQETAIAQGRDGGGRSCTGSKDCAAWGHRLKLTGPADG